MPIVAPHKVKWIRSVLQRIFFLLPETHQSNLLLEIPRLILPQSIPQSFLLLRLCQYLPLLRLNM
jgi:hypothetical protein